MECKTVADILRYSKPSYVCEGRDVEHIDRLMEAYRRWQVQCAKKFMVEHRSEPMLVWYGSDSTPLATRQTYRMALDDLAVWRKGRESHEYVIQRCFLESGNDRFVVVEEPIKLLDKTAWAHFEAFRKLLPLPRMAGHTGIVILAHCYDGALFSACRRLHKRYLGALAHRQSIEGIDEGTARMLELTSWPVYLQCQNHTMHNALKWAIMDMCDREIVRSCFISVESLRSGYGQLMANISSWVRRRLAFEDWDLPCQSELWTVLGVEPQWGEKMEAMQLRFDAGQMKVASNLEGEDEKVVQSVVAIFMHVLKLRKFSDSRWVSLGCSCRTLVCAEILGLSALVEHIVQSPNESSYYLSGFSRFRGPVRRMVAVTSIVSYLPDTVLASLLEDDRVPKMLEKIDADIAEETHFMANISPPIWKCIEQSMGYEGNLRHDCLAACLVAVGYIEAGLRPARQLPWSLCTGDADLQLDRLQAGPLPRDETSMRIREMLDLGWNRNEIKEGLRLLSQVSWSSTTTEQAHAAASTIMRQHRFYSEATMRSRALLAQARTLFAEDPERRKVETLRGKLERLQRRRPERINGRHVLVQDLAELATLKRGRQSEPMSLNLTTRLVRNSGQIWSNMPGVTKASYNRRAAELREATLDEVKAKKQEIANAIGLVRSRSAQLEADLPLRMSTCRLSNERRMSFDTFYKEFDLTNEQIKQLRREACEAKGQSPEWVKRALEQFGEDEVGSAGPPLPWLGMVCRNRSFFVGLAFRFHAPDGDRCWLLAYAKQNPLFCAFVALEALCDDRSLSSGMAHLFDPFLHEREHNFQISLQDWAFTDDGIFAADWDFDVLMDCNIAAQNRLRSDASWMTFAEVSALFPAAPSVVREDAGVDGHVAKEDRAPEPWEEHPWLLDLWPELSGSGRSGDPTSRARGAMCKGGDKHEEPEPDDSDGSEFDAGAAFDELNARRVLWNECTDVVCEDFRWKLRGGAWTAKTKGQAFDCFLSECSNSLATDFCGTFGLVRSASFSVNVYSESGAQQLAQAWCEIHQAWFNIWHMRSGCDQNFRFTAADIVNCPEAPALAPLLQSDNPKTRARALAMQALRPRRLDEL